MVLFLARPVYLGVRRQADGGTEHFGRMARIGSLQFLLSPPNQTHLHQKEWFISDIQSCSFSLMADESKTSCWRVSIILGW
mmetsp:Transcript_35359/g.73623  ORF Transcript_35359/g.73623 Transcript_35359/m.73623 type:complete len:81 (-) Transcript_35359:194-436(-)